MGGGKVTRPNFGLGQPDPGHPMTEFYTLLLEALAGAESFALPGLYAKFDPPAWPIEPEEAPDWCALSPAPQSGFCPDPAAGTAAGARRRTAVHPRRGPCRPDADRGGPPDHLRGAAAAALSSGRRTRRPRPGRTPPAL